MVLFLRLFLPPLVTIANFDCVFVVTGLVTGFVTGLVTGLVFIIFVLLFGDENHEKGFHELDVEVVDVVDMALLFVLVLEVNGQNPPFFVFLILLFLVIVSILFA